METLSLADRAIVDFAPKLIVAADGEPAVSSMDMIEAVIASGVAAERRRVPMNEARYLAFDLGAESGRAVVGSFDGKKLALEEIHRFPNGPVAVHGHLHWDALRLFEEVRRSIQACAHRHRTIEGIGVNTWGVDFALLDRGGELLANPYCYRDPRTNGMMAWTECSRGSGSSSSPGSSSCRSTPSTSSLPRPWSGRRSWTPLRRSS
jgi:hypothetical protein